MTAYSPNGAEIAYISPNGLGVAAADGSQARVLVPGVLDEDFPLSAYGLEWSPTGDRIAFLRASKESMGTGRADELAVVDVASGKVVSLAKLTRIFPYIKFSPEGDQILFTRPDPDAKSASSLWSVHTDGSNLHRLVAGADWGDWQTLIPTR
jgi:Tol biopolymer transport system component